MTYKRCGWLSGICFLGVLLSGGMTENGRIDLFSGAAIMLALLAVGFVAARASVLFAAYEHRQRYRGRYR